jgi:hypothetical protein
VEDSCLIYVFDPNNYNQLGTKQKKLYPPLGCEWFWLDNLPYPLQKEELPSQDARFQPEVSRKNRLLSILVASITHFR